MTEKPRWNTPANGRYGRNPQYYNFDRLGGDCTNYVSQCLHAGGAVMNYRPVTGWFYRSANDRTASWTGVEYIYRFLTEKRRFGTVRTGIPRGRIAGGDWYNWEGIREIFTIRPSSSDFRAGLSLPPTLTTRTTNLSIHTISNGCAGYTFSASAFPTGKRGVEFSNSTPLFYFNFSIIAHSAAAELKFAGTISAGEMLTSKRSVSRRRSP